MSESAVFALLRPSNRAADTREGVVDEPGDRLRASEKEFVDVTAVLGRFVDQAGERIRLLNEESMGGARETIASSAFGSAPHIRMR